MATKKKTNAYKVLRMNKNGFINVIKESNYDKNKVIFDKDYTIVKDKKIIKFEFEKRGLGAVDIPDEGNDADPIVAPPTNKPELIQK